MFGANIYGPLDDRNGCTNIYGLLDGGGECWLYYKFAAPSFSTRKLCSRLYSIENEFYSNNQTLLFEPLFGDLG